MLTSADKKPVIKIREYVDKPTNTSFIGLFYAEYLRGWIWSTLIYWHLFFAQKMLIHKNIFLRANNPSPPIPFWKATDMQALICLFTLNFVFKV